MSEELYCVYRIVCTVTGKCYVGQTVDEVRRWRTHKSKLNRGRHYNHLLQTEWSSIGSQFFYFEVLERDIMPELVNSRERAWICEYKSASEGYNCNRGFSKSFNQSRDGKRFLWNGIEQRSYYALAKAKGVSTNKIKEWLFYGYTCDQDVEAGVINVNIIDYAGMKTYLKSIG